MNKKIILYMALSVIILQQHCLVASSMLSQVSSATSAVLKGVVASSPTIKDIQKNSARILKALTDSSTPLVSLAKEYPKSTVAIAAAGALYGGYRLDLHNKVAHQTGALAHNYLPENRVGNWYIRKQHYKPNNLAYNVRVDKAFASYPELYNITDRQMQGKVVHNVQLLDSVFTDYIQIELADLIELWKQKSKEVVSQVIHGASDQRLLRLAQWGQRLANVLLQEKSALNLL